MVFGVYAGTSKKQTVIALELQVGARIGGELIKGGQNVQNFN